MKKGFFVIYKSEKQLGDTRQPTATRNLSCNVSVAKTDHGRRRGEKPRAEGRIGSRGQRKIRGDGSVGLSARVSGCHYWPQTVWLLVSVPVRERKKKTREKKRIITKRYTFYVPGQCRLGTNVQEFVNGTWLLETFFKNRGQTLVLFYQVSKEVSTVSKVLFLDAIRYLRMNAGIRLGYEEFRICFSAEVDAVVTLSLAFARVWRGVDGYLDSSSSLLVIRRLGSSDNEPNGRSNYLTVFLRQINTWCNYLALEAFTSVNQNFENDEVWWEHLRRRWIMAGKKNNRKGMLGRLGTRTKRVPRSVQIKE